MTDQPWLDRDRLRLIVLLTATALVAVICFLITLPFVPALTWALALAIVAHPIHRRIGDRIARPDVAAGVSVTAVAVILIVPFAAVTHQAGSEIAQLLESANGEGGVTELRRQLETQPAIASVIAWIERQFDVRSEMDNFTETARRWAGRALRGTIWTAIQLAVALFALFYFFRDQREIMTTMRGLVPLSTREVEEVFERIRSMVNASIYGAVAVAFVQGALGGLMFWFLGLPAPLLWGVAMALLALIPILGAFVIWAPAAAFLAMNGDWFKAITLTVWGTVVVGLIDNLLYPVLVGREMRLHTLPVFVAVVGGLFVFGAAGIVIGPVALAVMLALIDILRRRTVAGRPAEQPV